MTKEEMLREALMNALNETSDGYPSLKIANRYLNPAPKRKNSSGQSVYPSTVLVKIPKPKDSGDKQQFFTRSFKLKDVSEAKSVVALARAKRDEFFKDLYAKNYHWKNLLRSNTNGETNAGWVGVTLSLLTLEYKVSYLDDSMKRRYKRVSILNKRSDIKAYLEACRLRDEGAGEDVQSDSVYLDAKSIGVPDDALTAALKERDRLRDVKAEFSGTKRGIELSIVHGRFGFFVKKQNKEQGKIEATLVSAHSFGEDDAFVEACMLRDELDGAPISSREEYMSLKPDTIFTSLCA